MFHSVSSSNIFNNLRNAYKLPAITLLLVLLETSQLIILNDMIFTSLTSVQSVSYVNFYLPLYLICPIFFFRFLMHDSESNCLVSGRDEMANIMKTYLGVERRVTCIYTSSSLNLTLGVLVSLFLLLTLLGARTYTSQAMKYVVTVIKLILSLFFHLCYGLIMIILTNTLTHSILNENVTSISFDFYYAIIQLAVYATLGLSYYRDFEDSVSDSDSFLVIASDIEVHSKVLFPIFMGFVINSLQLHSTFLTVCKVVTVLAYLIQAYIQFSTMGVRVWCRVEKLRSVMFIFYLSTMAVNVVWTVFYSPEEETNLRLQEVLNIICVLILTVLMTLLLFKYSSGNEFSLFDKDIIQEDYLLHVFLINLFNRTSMIFIETLSYSKYTNFLIHKKQKELTNKFFEQLSEFLLGNKIQNSSRTSYREYLQENFPLSKRNNDTLKQDSEFKTFTKSILELIKTVRINIHSSSKGSLQVIKELLVLLKISYYILIDDNNLNSCFYINKYNERISKNKREFSLKFKLTIGYINILYRNSLANTKGIDATYYKYIKLGEEYKRIIQALKIMTNISNEHERMRYIIKATPNLGDIHMRIRSITDEISKIYKAKDNPTISKFLWIYYHLYNEEYNPNLQLDDSDSHVDLIDQISLGQNTSFVLELQGKDFIIKKAPLNYLEELELPDSSSLIDANFEDIFPYALRSHEKKQIKVDLMNSNPLQRDTLVVDRRNYIFKAKIKYMVLPTTDKKVILTCNVAIENKDEGVMLINDIGKIINVNKYIRENLGLTSFLLKNEHVSFNRLFNNQPGWSALNEDIGNLKSRGKVNMNFNMNRYLNDLNNYFNFKDLNVVLKETEQFNMGTFINNIKRISSINNHDVTVKISSSEIDLDDIVSFKYMMINFTFNHLESNRNSKMLTENKTISSSIKNDFNYNSSSAYASSGSNNNGNTTTTSNQSFMSKIKGLRLLTKISLLRLIVIFLNSISIIASITFFFIIYFKSNSLLNKFATQLCLRNINSDFMRNMDMATTMLRLNESSITFIQEYNINKFINARKDFSEIHRNCINDIYNYFDEDIIRQINLDVQIIFSNNKETTMPLFEALNLVKNSFYILSNYKPYYISLDKYNEQDNTDPNIMELAFLINNYPELQGKIGQSRILLRVESKKYLNDFYSTIILLFSVIMVFHFLPLTLQIKDINNFRKKLLIKINGIKSITMNGLNKLTKKFDLILKVVNSESKLKDLKQKDETHTKLKGIKKIDPQDNVENIEHAMKELSNLEIPIVTILRKLIVFINTLFIGMILLGFPIVVNYYNLSIESLYFSSSLINVNIRSLNAIVGTRCQLIQNDRNYVKTLNISNELSEVYDHLLNVIKLSNSMSIGSYVAYYYSQISGEALCKEITLYEDEKFRDIITKDCLLYPMYKSDPSNVYSFYLEGIRSILSSYDGNNNKDILNSSHYEKLNYIANVFMQNYTVLTRKRFLGEIFYPQIGILIELTFVLLCLMILIVVLNFVLIKMVVLRKLERYMEDLTKFCKCLKVNKGNY